MVVHFIFMFHNTHMFCFSIVCIKYYILNMYKIFNYICLNICREKAMAPHSSTFAWRIPWTEEPGRLQSMGSLRVGHDWATSLSLFIFMHWRRKWQPTPSSVLAWRIPGTGKPGGLLSMGLHSVGHDWSDLAAVANVYSHEIKRCLLLGRKVMTNLDSILKSRDITLPTNVRLVKVMVFPVVMYGCKSWTIKKADHLRIDAFELWC